MEQVKKEKLYHLSQKKINTFENHEICVILDDVRSALNVGSIFRTSDAFLISSIHLCGITSKPPHKEINKTALGSQNTVAWKYWDTTEYCCSELKKKGFDIICIEQVTQSISLEKFIPGPSKKYALIFGNEVYGIKENIIKQSDKIVEIPQFGTKHSLNISVSVGIVLWDIIFKIKLCGYAH